MLRLNFAKHFIAVICLGVVPILAAGGGLVLLINQHYQSGHQANLKTYRASSEAQLVETVDTVEGVFETIYRDLRMIARLPGVRSLDLGTADSIEFRNGKGLEENTRHTAQEVYSGLATGVAVSELYIVPVNFDPDAVHSDTHDFYREPIATFDDLILNRTAQGPADEHHGPEEIEIHEYRLMRKQLGWFKHHYPHQSRIAGLAYPALAGPEVVTCDNSRYSPGRPNDKDRSGIVLSVPFYDEDGILKGCVSAVILTGALADLLPQGKYAIVNPKYDYYTINGSRGQAWDSIDHVEAGLSDPGLIYSQTQPLNTHDQNGGWTLWIGNPDEQFWTRPDVITAVLTRNLGYAFAAVLITIALICFWLVVRSQRNITLANRSLESKIQEQTIELQETIDAYGRHKTAIDQHALVLTADVRGIITHANLMLCQVSGYAENELTGQHWKILEGRDMTETLSHEIWRILAQGQTWRGELQQRAKDGCHYWVQNTTAPIKDDTGAVTHFIIVQTDISEFKQAQRQHLRDATGTRLTG